MPQRAVDIISGCAVCAVLCLLCRVCCAVCVYWGCVWCVRVCVCRVACLLLAVRAQLSQNSWQRLLGDLADSWRVRVDLLGTILAPFLDNFWVILAQFWDIWASFWHPGALGAHMSEKGGNKIAGGGASLYLWDTFWEPIFGNFRTRGRFFGRRFLHLILERPRERPSSQNGPKKAPKWQPKGSQKVTFWTRARCELDILFAIFGAHKPSRGRSKKASKIGAVIGTGPGVHF